MEPASDETEKETNLNSEDNAQKEHDSDPAIDESEFQRCSRKGRRDACPDIHCKGSDSEQSEQCLFHKNARESDLEKESAAGQKT